MQETLPSVSWRTQWAQGCISTHLVSAALFNHTCCCFVSKHYGPMHPQVSSFSCYGKRNLFIFFRVHSYSVYFLSFRFKRSAPVSVTPLLHFQKSASVLSPMVSLHTWQSSVCELLASFYKVFSVPSFVSVSKLKFLIMVTVLSVRPSVFLPTHAYLTSPI